MARNLDPKCKQCRRIGEKLFLKGERCFTSKCAMVKRNYPPGMHGNKRHMRLSEFGLQLKEKQKAARTYQVLEKQFHNYFKKAKRMPGDTGDNLLKLLELRLDNVIYRLEFAPSRSVARQMVSHGHITINSKKVDIPSYQTKAGNEIGIKPEKMDKQIYKEITKKISKKNLPSWLSYQDEKKLIAKVNNMPAKDEIGEGINTAMIVEFYSR